MILIRAALFAVFAFMGSISLSAQGAWVLPAQAKQILVTEMQTLNAPPSPPAPVIGVLQEVQMQQYAKNTGCPDCFLNKIKKEFLKRTYLKLQTGGTDTGVAVEAVRTELNNAAFGKPTVLATINDAYIYMQGIL